VQALDVLEPLAEWFYAAKYTSLISLAFWITTLRLPDYRY